MKLYGLFGFVLGLNRHIQHRFENGILERTPDDRYIFQFPFCRDPSCGLTGRQKQQKIDSGCLAKNEVLQGDRGQLTYPRLRPDGKRKLYGDRENCIWQIQSGSSKKWLKIRFTYVDVEYDAHCGLDKVHIFRGFIPKGGFRPHTVPKEEDVRIGRICGGSGFENKTQGGSGPMRHWRSFHDGSSRLTKYTGKECKLRQRKKRGKVVWERKPCLQHGFDNWIEIEGDSVTIAFDADQKKRLTGFTMVWETVDAPSPPVIFPTGSVPIAVGGQKIMKQVSGKAQGGQWGLLKLVRIETSWNPNEQRNKRHRAFNIWQDHLNFKRSMLQRLPSSCLRTEESDKLPKSLEERIRAELKKSFYQDKVRNLLRLYQDVLFWQFGSCGPLMGPQKWSMHNQVERVIGTIYRHEMTLKRGRHEFERIGETLRDVV